MTQPSARQVLIATLGSEPQVVTLVLDELRRRGQPIRDVVVVHTTAAAEPIRGSLQRLSEETRFYRKARPSVRFSFAPISRQDGGPVADVQTEEDAGAVFATLYREVLEAKRKGWGVHLSLAGGRKIMSAYGMAVAQMLFDEDDRLWHVLSEGPLLDEKRMHAQPGERVRLVPVPVLRWSLVSPAATELARTSDPFLAVQKQREMQHAAADAQKRAFLKEDLTPAERAAVELLVTKGLSDKQLAQKLGRSTKTVSNQLAAAYDKFSARFRGVRADRNVLIAELAPLLARR